MRSTDEILKHIAEQRLCGYRKQIMVTGNERNDAEMDAKQEWWEFLNELDLKTRRKFEKVQERFLELKDEEMEEMYLFGVKDGISLMKNIQNVKL